MRLAVGEIAKHTRKCPKTATYSRAPRSANHQLAFLGTKFLSGKGDLAYYVGLSEGPLRPDFRFYEDPSSLFLTHTALMELGNNEEELNPFQEMT